MVLGVCRLLRCSALWILALGLGASCVPQDSRPPTVAVKVSPGQGEDQDYWKLVQSQVGDLVVVTDPAGWPGATASVVSVAPQAPTAELVDLAALPRRTLDQFYPVAVDPRLQGGRLTRLVPSLSATHMFFANKRVLGSLGLEPATTYEALVAQVPVLRAAGVDVVLMANREPWVLEATLFSTLVGRFGGDDFVWGLKDGSKAFTDPPFVAALSLVRDLVADGVLSRQTLLVGSNDVARPFAEGRAAYLIDGDWRVASLTTDPATGRSLLDHEDQGDIALLVFPRVPGELAPVASVALGPGWGVPLGQADLEPALSVIEALEGQTSQSWRLEAQHVFPSRTDVDLQRLDPLERAKAPFYLALQGTPVLEGHLPAGVLEVLHRGLRGLVLGTVRPSDLAQDLQRAWDENATKP